MRKHRGGGVLFRAVTCHTRGASARGGVWFFLLVVFGSSSLSPGRGVGPSTCPTSPTASSSSARAPAGACPSGASPAPTFPPGAGDGWTQPHPQPARTRPPTGLGSTPREQRGVREAVAAPGEGRPPPLPLPLRTRRGPRRRRRRHPAPLRSQRPRRLPAASLLACTLPPYSQVPPCSEFHSDLM